MLKVGIDAANFYTPACYLDLKTLSQMRGVPLEKYHSGLGQYQMAVIPPDEDIVTMAAAAASRLLRQVNKDDISLVLFATESGIDQSKAAGIFVHQLLNLPARCRVVELKQACYSATAGLQLAMPMLRDNPMMKILLIASDIARYGLNTSGESSQGGGALAMLLTSQPRLLAIEPESGYHTEDVMDFWRPNYREEALVEGKHSCELYLKLVQKTWLDYQALSMRQFQDHARFCYHVSVPRLSEKAHQQLVKVCGQAKLSEADLSRTQYHQLRYGRRLGNCYTGALYLSLISLLEQDPEDLSQQRIGLYSYGSGCAAEFFSGVVQPGYQSRLDRTYHQNLLDARRELTGPEYEAFYNFQTPIDGSDCTLERTDSSAAYRLKALRGHKRIYEAIA